MAALITRIETLLLAVPLDEPIRHPFLGARTKSSMLIVRIHTSDGCEGLGFAAIESTKQMRAVRDIVDDLAVPLVGMDALRREQIFARMWGLRVDLMHEGAANLALATIDIALWDIAGKQANMPLWLLLGGFRDKVAAYASHRLWRHHDIDRLQSDAAAMVKAGFNAMKLRLGNRPLAEDLARARALREAVGPDIHIMTDALWSQQGPDAVRLGDGLEALGIYWYEEPVREGDYEGLARVHQMCRITLAAGERISRLVELPLLLPLVDHLILDIHHLGGITPFLTAARMAGARPIPLSAHSAHEIALHTLAALPQGAWLEYFPWRDALFRKPPVFERGFVLPNPEPGLGLELDPAALTRFAADLA